MHTAHNIFLCLTRAQGHQMVVTYAMSWGPELVTICVSVFLPLQWQQDNIATHDPSSGPTWINLLSFRHAACVSALNKVHRATLFKSLSPAGTASSDKLQPPRSHRGANLSAPPRTGATPPQPLRAPTDTYSDREARSRQGYGYLA